MGYLQSHADMLITMYENLRKAGRTHYDAVAVLADAMAVTGSEIEMVLPVSIGGEQS